MLPNAVIKDKPSFLLRCAFSIPQKNLWVSLLCLFVLNHQNMMNSCRDLPALFLLHELLIYHTWLTQTIPPNEHYHTPAYIEPPNTAHCTTLLWLQQQKASLFFRKRAEHLLHCSKRAALLKSQCLRSADSVYSGLCSFQQHCQG